MPRNNPYSDVPSAPSELDLLEIGSELELEIGFGRGHFILDRAEAQPKAFVLGLEMRRKWVALVASRAERRGLENVKTEWLWTCTAFNLGKLARELSRMRAEFSKLAAEDAN